MKEGVKVFDIRNYSELHGKGNKRFIIQNGKLRHKWICEVSEIQVWDCKDVQNCRLWEQRRRQAGTCDIECYDWDLLLNFTSYVWDYSCNIFPFCCFSSPFYFSFTEEPFKAVITKKKTVWVLPSAIFLCYHFTRLFYKVSQLFKSLWILMWISLRMYSFFSWDSCHAILNKRNKQTNIAWYREQNSRITMAESSRRVEATN